MSVILLNFFTVSQLMEDENVFFTIFLKKFHKK